MIRSHEGWYCWGQSEPREWRHRFNALYNIAIPKVKYFDVAVDVGSNIGISVYFLAQSFGYVYAFEPDKQNIESFKKNSVDHGFAANTHLFEYACGEVNERMSLTGNSGINRHYAPGEDVSVVKLDDVIKMKIGLLKVDAEGMDFLVLKGAKNLILNSKPVVIFEYKDGDKRHERWNSLTDSEDFMKSLGAKLEHKGKVDQIWYFE